MTRRLLATSGDTVCIQVKGTMVSRLSMLGFWNMLGHLLAFVEGDALRCTSVQWVTAVHNNIKQEKHGHT